MHDRGFFCLMERLAAQADEAQGARAAGRLLGTPRLRHVVTLAGAVAVTAVGVRLARARLA
ncbi:hypothetical protein ACH4SP_10705 [Streptomyces sp. NPDC021093]|uniref:hypothetical protein n=1 Tax=Streptomyces sp. NPDC021093 TaxID=3365112 RepID=UPI00379BAB81